MKPESIRLIFKEISFDDIEDIHLLHSFPEVDEFNTIGIHGSIEVTKELIRSMVENKDNIPYAIIEDDPRDY